MLLLRRVLPCWQMLLKRHADFVAENGHSRVLVQAIICWLMLVHCDVDAGSPMHMQLYLECRDLILTRYGPTLDHGDRLVHTMKRIDDRLTVMEQWSYRSQMTSSMTAYFNENLP